MPTLNRPQARFLALPHRYRAFVAGYGSGKTHVGSAGLCAHAWEHPGAPQGYFAPTYPMVRDIFWPTIEQVADDWGLSATIRRGDHEVLLTAAGKVRSHIICRSMDRPETIVGYSIGHALVDELDTLRHDQAQAAWRKIIARMRYGAGSATKQVDVTTTPEGYRFVHAQWVAAVAEKPALADMYGMVQARTADNERNLPAGYIQGMRESYPPALVQAYLDGKFVNLTSGAVYPDFDRAKNGCADTIKEGDTLHVGMDFNVLKMYAAVCVVRDGEPRAVDELVDVRDTPTMARLLREKFPERHMIVYPDASGASTKSVGASQSDLTILAGAGLEVRATYSNPAVKDRVAAVNALILNGAGQRRFRVNTAACPHLTKCLEQQAYDKNGDPDKSAGLDHPPDALGYYLAHTWPVTNQAMRRLRVVGI